MKTKAIVYPLIMIMALLGLLFYEHLKTETTLPSEGWSRSIDFGVTSSILSNPYATRLADFYHIYFPTEKGIAHLTLNQQLKVEQRSTLPLQIPSNTHLWANEKRIIFVDQSELKLYDGDTTKTLVKNVTNFRVNKESLLYWNENELYELDVNSMQSKPISVFPSKIFDVIVGKQTAEYLVVLEVNPSQYELIMIEPNASGQPNMNRLTDLTLIGSERLEEVCFTRENENVYIVYGTYSLAQGIKAYRAYEMKLSLNNLSTIGNGNEIQFYDERFARKLLNPRYLEISVNKGQVTVLFTASGPSSSRSEEVNVYEAKKVDNQWIASRRSTTHDVSLEPFWLTKETILWLGFSGKDYKLYAASTDLKVINDSQKINRTDWEHALSNMIMSLFGSTMTLIFMLFWFILPSAFYLVMYYFNDRFIEHHSQRAAFIMIILYIISQLILFTKGLSMASYYYAPTYLSFPGSLIILPLLMAVLTWFIWRTVEDEEWGIIGNFAYFAVVNALLIMFSLGPYIL
jgi:hypothetical protein